MNLTKAPEKGLMYATLCNGWNLWLWPNDG